MVLRKAWFSQNCMALQYRPHLQGLSQRWRRHVPPKCRAISEPNGIKTQTTVSSKLNMLDLMFSQL
jgi:hypothetical protein